jgi:hypothetical protein
MVDFIVDSRVQITIVKRSSLHKNFEDNPRHDNHEKISKIDHAKQDLKTHT